MEITDLMFLLRRHEGHEHGGEEEEEEEEHHHHPSEDGLRNHNMATLYWYTVAAVLILGLLGRLISAVIARQRIQRRRSGSDSPTAASSLERLLQGPKAVVSASFLGSRRPGFLIGLPLRKTFIVVVYAALISFLLTFKSIKHDANFYERVGFRGAWVTTTQTSMPFLLAARFNPIGLVLGTSYERINWFHRWASRIFLASATVHGGFFVTEWIKADFFWDELRTVKMVIPGMGAWFVLVWTLISSFLPIRHWKYEFFVFQHIVSVLILLVLLILHVPDHHQFSIWCAVVVYAYDVVTRCANPIWRNIRLRLPPNIMGRVSRYAHQAHVSAVDKDLTIVTIRNVPFSWAPGQHVLIWCPLFWKQSPHPFTISSVPGSASGSQDVQLTLKTKGGLTKKLNEWATENSGGDGNLRLFLAGPYGSLPNWRQFDNVVLIAASTGGSFTTPVLEDLLTSPSPGCVRRINAIYIARRKAHVEPYLRRISQVISRAKEIGISVRVEVAITEGGPKDALGKSHGNDSREGLMAAVPDTPSRSDSVELERFSVDSEGSDGSDRLLKEEMDLAMDDERVYDSSFATETAGRPDIAAFLRTAVGGVPGHVSVAVCGGLAIERAVQKGVAALRRERASEGGVQDIMVHLERSDI